MKKRLIFLFFLINLYNAEAQVSDLLGEEPSIIILLPLVLIIIMAIAFIIMFITDTKNYYVYKKVVNLPNIGKTKAIVKEELKNKVEEKIWINYLDIIDTFAKRLDQRDSKESFNILVKMIKEFFRDRFNLNYEFTYDELIKEFEKRDFHGKKLILDLRELTYKDKNIDKKLIYEFSTNFRDIIRIIDRQKLEEIGSININNNIKINKIRKMIFDLQKKEGQIDNKINKFISYGGKKIFSLNRNKQKIEIKKDFDEFDKDKLEQISLLIKNGRESLNKNEINKLRDIYGDICYLFPFLSDKSKKIAYLEILEFYEEMNIKLFPKLYKGN